MYISRSYLKNIATDSVTYYRGVDYYGERRVTIWKDYLSASGEHMVESQVRGSRMSQYYCKVVLDDAEGKVQTYACSCPAHYAYDGACKHVIATVLQAENGEMEAGRTDEGIRRLMEQAVGAEQDLPLPQAPVTLEPTLVFGSYTRYASFKVGRERMYVIKNLPQFCRDVAGGRFVEYGRQLAFFNTMEAFEETSRPLLRYLLSHVPAERQGSAYYAPVVKNLELTEYMMDELLDLYLGRRIYLETQASLTLASVVDRNPDLTLELNENKNGCFSLRLEGQWQQFEGYAHCYLLRHEVLYRCNEAFTKACRGLLRLLLEKKSLMVRREDMPAFAAAVLAPARAHLELRSNTDLEPLMPRPLHTKVYFDLTESDEVSAKVLYCYGEQEFSLFTPAKGGDCRDVPRERQVERLLAAYLPRRDYEEELLFTTDGEDGMFRLMDEGLEPIAAAAEIYATDRFHAAGIRPLSGIRVGVRLRSSLLELTVEPGNLNIKELAAVLSSYKKAKRYHRMRDGSFLSLKNSSLGELERLTRQMDLTDRELCGGKAALPSYRAMALDRLMEEGSSIQYERGASFLEAVEHMRNASQPSAKLPETLAPVLRKYQKKGFSWLTGLAACRFGGILADDMGLGKTLQVIALLLSEKETAAEHTVSLVVCPSSLVYNWVSEIEKFAPALSACAVMGAAVKRRELLGMWRERDVLVTSYDSLKRDVEEYGPLAFRFQILDEAQYIKNHATQSAKAAKAVKSEVRFALTGTPVENSLGELWSIFDFLMPGYLYSYAKFKRQYELPIARHESDAAMAELNAMVRPFLLRRLKSQVLTELPEKTQTIMYAKLEGEQERLYTANIALAQRELFQEFKKEKKEQKKIRVLAMLTRLRQLCCDPALVYDGYEGSSAKLELCMELLESSVESGHRLLLFSQFTTMLERIARRLRAVGVAFYTITGATPSQQRLELVNAFNAGDVPVFLISLKAGGTGLNLTGADVVIHYDPWWNNSAQNQATDRSHRLGQKRSVQVYKLIAKDTVEEKILRMQESKEALAEKVVREGDGGIAQMSEDELMRLFQV